MSDQLATPDRGPMSDDHEPGEFRCHECGNRCTRGPDGVEYGHCAGYHTGTERCSRRPGEQVDPIAPSERGDR